MMKRIASLGQVKRELEEEDLGPEGDGGRIDEDMVAFGYKEFKFPTCQ